MQRGKAEYQVTTEMRVLDSSSANSREVPAHTYFIKICPYYDQDHTDFDLDTGLLKKLEEQNLIAIEEGAPKNTIKREVNLNC